ncbi:S8 family peptidase [Paenibacillus koleovorans]|uniref:S8 family peptidase n=1 Tax=Paenibacillus koleovorans TaxID=121608 RepID=UPI000FD8F8C8|nr:S8 family peptidase [Paenibacillus koleovorans]
MHKHKQRNKMSVSLKQHIRGCRAKGMAPRRFKVIVELCKPASGGCLKKLRSSMAGSGRRFRIRRKLEIIGSVAAEVHASCLSKLLRHSSVKRVHHDTKLRTRLNIATPSIGSTLLQRRGLTGRGVTIGIIDTGVYPHPDLVKPVNRIVGFRDFLGGRCHPYDDNGHGTHVAGDAAGNGRSSRGKYTGPSPKARLVVAKAFNRFGEGDTSDVIAAIDWIVRTRHKFGTRIVNMSFGGPPGGSCEEDPLCRAVGRAWDRGLIVVASAGNEGPGARTIDSPGINPKIITVGATDDLRTLKQTDDQVAPFSSRGPAPDRKTKPDLVAPGVDIVSLRAPGSFLDRREPFNRVANSYFRMSGTSMSTPIVAGAIAQLLQRFPRLTNEQVKSLLRRSAIRLRKGGPNVQGSGEVSLFGFAAAKPIPRCRPSRQAVKKTVASR